MVSKSKRPQLLGPDGRVLKKLASVSPAWSGASTGRHGRNWMASNAGPSFITWGSLSTLRNRARDLARNDPWIKRAAKVYVSNLVGKGIRPVAKTPDAQFNRDVMELWNDWNLECDVTGTTSFYGIQAMAARGLYLSGENLVRFIYGASPTSLLPFQLQIMEPDYLDHTYLATLENGNRIIQGVEFGRYAPVAYHLFKDHPAEMVAGPNHFERVRIPASEILHQRLVDRPGQVRGVTELASILLKIMDVLEYEEAELTRKKFAAMFVAFVQTLSDDAEALKTMFGSELNEDGEEEAILESGTVQRLGAGETVTFTPAADVGGSYEPFIRQNHRALAAGSDATYEEFTGDLSTVNFTSARVGLNTIRRIHEQTQEFVLKPQLCVPVWKEFVQQAILSGAIAMPKGYLDNPRPWLRVHFVSPGWPFVNPQEEEAAAQAAIRGGTESRANVAAEKGYDVDELDRQQRRDLDRADQLDLVYDTDPRKVSRAGNSNQTQPPQEEDK